MAHHFIPEPDPDSAESLQPAGERMVEAPHAEAVRESFASDLANLKQKFSSDEGGHLSAELSAELALEVVLNEIVEQACVLAGATGAAVILRRDGKWECRASNGASAPELGARLGNESGLIAECIRTAQVQCCADAESDARVDAVACRNLGVRSMIALPLLRDAVLVGVFAAFSGQESAFGEQEAGTLGALSQSIMSTLELTYQQGEQPIEESSAAATLAALGTGARANANKAGADNGAPESLVGMDPPERTAEQKFEEAAVSHARSELEEFLPELEIAGKNRGQSLITWLLGAAVLASAVFLITIASWRLLGNDGARRHSLSVARGKNQPAGNRASLAHQTEPAPSTPVPAPAGAATSITSTKESATPEGGLTVFENGKEVFRMAPGASQGEIVSTAESTRAVGTSVAAGSNANVYAIPPQAAASSVIYRVEPVYPDEALKDQIQGSVVLKVHVGRDGAVQEVTPVSGEPMLANAAIMAVKQWRFRPHRVQGQAVEMETQVTLNFKLSE